MEIKVIWLAIAGLIGGYLGKYARIPGGVLLGSMILTSLVNAKGIHISKLPLIYVFSLQILTGALVGQKVTGRILKDIKDMMLSVVFLLGIIMSAVIILMLILYEIFGWDLVTAWLSASPGRMQDMIILAGTLNADGAKVATAHLVRQLSVILITPVILVISKKLEEKQREKLSNLKKDI